MSAKFKAWAFVDGVGDVFSPWYPSLDMAAIHAAAQMDGVIWEEETLPDGRVSWCQYERGDDGEWWPSLFGVLHAEMMRPWEVPTPRARE